MDSQVWWTHFAIGTLGGGAGFVYKSLREETITMAWTISTPPPGTLAADVNPSAFKNKSFRSNKRKGWLVLLGLLGKASCQKAHEVDLEGELAVRTAHGAGGRTQAVCGEDICGRTAIQRDGHRGPAGWMRWGQIRKEGWLAGGR